MTHVPQIKIAATYMRGGTSKGVFFRLQDLPEAAQAPGAARDALLLRVIGSPDPYGKQIDGMGGATPSTMSITYSARYRSIKPLSIGAVTAAICLLRWVHSRSLAV